MVTESHLQKIIGNFMGSNGRIQKINHPEHIPFKPTVRNIEKIVTDIRHFRKHETNIRRFNTTPGVLIMHIVCVIRCCRGLVG